MLRNIFPRFFSVLTFFIFCFFSLHNIVYAANDITTLNCEKTGDNKFKCIESVNCGTIYCDKNEVTEKTAQEIDQYQKNNPNANVNIGDGRPNGCNPFNGFSLTTCITSAISFIFTSILKFINWLLSFILWFSSFIFDLTVYFTIVKFKTSFADLQFAGVGSALFGSLASNGLIYYLWGMIRDFLNILIFLSIIYSAVQSMFDGFDGTRKKFIALLVFSIVANFSLLFVKLAIDVSNILALQAYTLAVKPKGTNSLGEFRTPLKENDPESYGEYIRRAVDLDKLLSSQAGIPSAQIQIDSTKNTFMFQLGRMIVYIGVIYILLFMSGLLLTRAVILLWAMIISPLIAADIFFKMMDPDDKLQTIAAGVRNITNKVKGDFYDALVKGPLLIFFVFLIGVFAESVLSQGVINGVAASFAKGEDVQLISDNPFTKSIFVFFKFALFIYLCNLFFGILNDIKLGGVGGNALRKYGGQFANKILGRGINGLSGLGGMVGRNTLGRAASNPSGRFGSTIANLNNRAEDWKKSEAFLKKNVGRILGNATKAIRTGSYDARGAVRPDSRLGKGIAGAAGGLINTLAPGSGKIDIGKARKEGFEEALKKREEDSKKKIDEAIKDAGKGLMATKEMIDEANKQKIGDSAVTLEMLDKVLSDQGISKKLSQGQALSDGEKKAAGLESLSSKDIQVLSSAVKREPDILNKIDAARDKSKEIVDKKVAEKKKEMEKQIRQEVEDSVKPGAKLTEKLTRTGSSYTELLSDAITGNRSDIQEGVADKFRREEYKSKTEKTKEDIRKQIKRFAVANEVQDELQNDLEEVENAIKLADVLTPIQFSKLADLRSEIKQKLDNLNIPDGKVDENKRKEVVDTFDEKFRSDLLRVKESSSQLMKDIYSKKDSPEFIKKLRDKRNSAQDELSALQDLKPDITGKSREEALQINKIHARELRETRRRFEFFDNALKNGYGNAKRSGDAFERIKERIDSNFSENKPDTTKG